MHTRTCSKCKQTLPSSLFKYRSTRAEAIKKGFSGDTCVWMESTKCKACRPKRVPVSKLPPKELANRVSAGDIPAHQANTILEERELNRRRKISGYQFIHHAMVKNPSLRPDNLKMYMLDQAIRKQQIEDLKQTRRAAKIIKQLTTPKRKRGRPTKKLIPTI
jgi:hypothetical protein